VPPATTSSPVRRRMTKGARRSQILANARRVFGELGYSGATMEEIAARSGVARSLLYEHVDSLDEVYLECMQDARSELASHVMAAAIVPGGPEARLRAGIHAYFTFVKDYGRGWDVLFASGPAPHAPVGKFAAEMRLGTAEQIATLFMAELPRLQPGEAQAYAHAVTGAGEQLARWWRYNPDVPLEAVVERMMTIVWGGMQDVFEELGDPEL
jgi:AcrR family transcriptional regulator